ncbi:hypothetical protein [Aeromicrobium sp. CF3.5]|uniref:hypothetical protein n=1 Tax=Aeromicrobium sp. CF3.5 TaxID=3373078 RepID=UPI003EE7D95B
MSAIMSEGRTPRSAGVSDVRPRLKLVGGTPAMRRGLHDIVVDDGACQDHENSGTRRIVIVIHEAGESVLPAPHREDEHEIIVAAVSGDDAFWAALARGYDGVVDLRGSESSTALGVRAALVGQFVVSAAMANQMMRGSATVENVPSAHELAWLARLSTGWSVLELAETELLSERVMYRRLAAVYRRLGVASRTEAIATVARAGLLDPRHVSPRP